MGGQIVDMLDNFIYCTNCRLSALHELFVVWPKVEQGLLEWVVHVVPAVVHQAPAALAKGVHARGFGARSKR
jgi:hypothetical protein